MIIPIKQILLEEGYKSFSNNFKKPTLFILKGNPKYNNRNSKKFYTTLNELGTKCGYKIDFRESDTKHPDIINASKDDIIIGFSRGSGYAKIFKHFGCKAKFIGIGTAPEPAIDYLINNPKDKTIGKTPDEFDDESLLQHFTLTPLMIEQISKILRKG